MFYKKSKLLIDSLSNSMNRLIQGNSIGNISSSATQINSNGNSKVIINGTVYSGNSVQIDGDKVIIDGKLQDTIEQKEIKIVIQGDCEDITTTNGTVNVSGSAGNVKTHNGTVNVEGSIVGDCETHNGNVKVKGSIVGKCKTHNGNISGR